MSFGGDVGNWVNKTKARNAKIVSDVFIQFSTRIVNRTPIGDVSLWGSPPKAGYRPGELVNNWHAGIGNVPSLVIRSPNVNGAESLGQIQQIANKAAGHIAYLANPAPHARRVEFGWSTQAPQGMVRVTVREFQDIVRSVVNAS